MGIFFLWLILSVSDSVHPLPLPPSPLLIRARSKNGSNMLTPVFYDNKMNLLFLYLTLIGRRSPGEIAAFCRRETATGRFPKVSAPRKRLPPTPPTLKGELEMRTALTPKDRLVPLRPNLRTRTKEKETTVA